MEPFLPGPPDPLIAFLQPKPIACNAVIGVVASNFPAQLPVLLHNRCMPIATTPLVDSFQSSAQALPGRLVLDDPFPPTRLAPVVGKAQKIEGPRSLPLGATRSPECHQLGLVWVDRQSVLPEALGEHPSHLLRVLLELKAHNRVVRKACDERTTSQSWFHFLSEPLVENVVEIDITEQW